MDPIVPGNVVDLLTGDPAGRTWLVLIGAILVAVVAIARYVTDGRLPEPLGAWVSAVCGVVGAIGVAYMAGVPEWWHGLVIGFVASPASRGFWSLFRSLLPGRDEEPE